MIIPTIPVTRFQALPRDMTLSVRCLQGDRTRIVAGIAGSFYVYARQCMFVFVTRGLEDRFTIEILTVDVMYSLAFVVH